MQTFFLSGSYHQTNLDCRREGSCHAGARRDSHKPSESLELQNFTGKILATGSKAAQAGSLASKCIGGAFSGNLDGGAGTPRNTAAADAAGQYRFCVSSPLLLT